MSMGGCLAGRSGSDGGGFAQRSQPIANATDTQTATMTPDRHLQRIARFLGRCASRAAERLGCRPMPGESLSSPPRSPMSHGGAYAAPALTAKHVERIAIPSKYTTDERRSAF